MSPTTSYYDLRDALTKPGCPICSLTALAAERYLGSLLWEKVNDVGLRSQIRQARGFCRDHAWNLASHRAALGTAIITRDVLRTLLEELEEPHPRGPFPLSLRGPQESRRARQAATASNALAVRLAPQASCPACAQVDEMEDVLLTTFVVHLLGPEGLLTPYEASDGLCLPHFCQALDRVRNQRVLAALVRAQTTIWRRLSGQLSEFIRKNDHRFRDEPWGDEGDSWRRAIAALAGSRPE